MSCLCFSASPQVHARSQPTSWHPAGTNGVARTRTRATTPKVTYRLTMKECRCCCLIVSWASSWYLASAPGTTTSWVSIQSSCIYISITCYISVDKCALSATFCFLVLFFLLFFEWSVGYIDVSTAPVSVSLILVCRFASQLFRFRDVKLILHFNLKLAGHLDKMWRHLAKHLIPDILM